MESQSILQAYEEENKRLFNKVHAVSVENNELKLMISEREKVVILEREKVIAKDKEVQELEKSLDTKSRSNFNQQQQLFTKDNIIAKYKADLESVKKVLSTVENVRTEQVKKIEGQHEEICQLKKDKDEAQKVISKNKEEIEKQNRLIEQLQKELAASRAKSVEDRLKIGQLDTEVNELREKIEYVEKQNSDLSKKLTTKTEKVSILEKQMADSEQKCKDEVVKHQEIINALRSQLSDNKKKEEERLVQFNEEIKSFHETISRGQDKLDAMSNFIVNEHSYKNSRNEKCKAILESLTIFLNRGVHENVLRQLENFNCANTEPTFSPDNPPSNDVNVFLNDTNPNIASASADFQPKTPPDSSGMETSDQPETEQNLPGHDSLAPKEPTSIRIFSTHVEKKKTNPSVDQRKTHGIDIYRVGNFCICGHKSVDLAALWIHIQESNNSATITSDECNKEQNNELENFSEDSDLEEGELPDRPSRTQVISITKR